MNERVVLDALSDWVMPPLSARDTRPVRVFDTAESAMLFLEMLPDLVVEVQRASAAAA
jgi:hypothetical protein